MALTQVHISPLDYERFGEVLSPEQLADFRATVEQARRLFAGRVIWNVNSTARGGGVAELLASLLAYTRGAGLDARWMVIAGNPDFFHVTKRIHNRLHGFDGDGGPLGDAERSVYEAALAPNAEELAALVKPGDLVLLHDPQTAGLVPALARLGCAVVWRCHVGLDVPNDNARDAWRFLQGYLGAADAYVFSRESFAWDDLDRDRIEIIAPSIDAFSPKNADMAPDVVAAVLDTIGLAAGGSSAPPTYVRPDGSPSRVDRSAEIVQEQPLRGDDRVLVQVSRWDRLKDPLGVMDAFAAGIAPGSDAHLVLAGPSTASVADDPEGAEVYRESARFRESLLDGVRARVHLVSLPMDDLYENAAMVNAIQRRADVLAQKSLAEGFGLTVAEGMWKARPVVASRVGGIQDQIVDGESGVLVDPTDRDGFARAVAGLLADPARAESLGRAARERVREHFLGTRSLGQYARLLARLIAG